MQSKATSIEEFVDELAADRKQAITTLQEVILKNTPAGFEEAISYGMIGYVVPHSLYPKGYYCNTKLPLPFININSQKISLPFITWEFMPIRLCSTGF